MSAVLDAVLVGAVLVAALAAVLARRRDAAAAAFLIFGVVLAILWARLDAPDIALAEAALGGGVAGALLVDALGDRRPGSAERTPLVPAVVGVAAGALGAAWLAVTLHAIPDAAAPLAAEALRQTDEAGVEHPVTAVLLNYRSYDTLLEVAVLVVATICAASVPARPRRPAAAASPVLRLVVAVLLPPVALLAGWLLVAGTSRPGGAFQAGALLGAALVLAALAGVTGGPLARVPWLWWASGGMLAFIALAIGTAALGAGWLALDPGWAGAAILAIEAVLAVGIGVGLAAIFLAVRADEDPEPAPRREEASA